MTQTQGLESRCVWQAEESRINSLDCYLVPLGHNIYYFTHIMLWSSLMCQVFYEIKPLPGLAGRGGAICQWWWCLAGDISSGNLGVAERGVPPTQSGWGRAHGCKGQHHAASQSVPAKAQSGHASHLQSYLWRKYNCCDMRRINDGARWTGDGWGETQRIWEKKSALCGANDQAEYQALSLAFDD